MIKLIIIICVGGFWHCEYMNKEVGEFKTMAACEIAAKQLRAEGIAAHVLCEETN